MRIIKYARLIVLFLVLIIFSIHTEISFAGNKKEIKKLQLSGMIFIPAGWFWMGCSPKDMHCNPSEKPYYPSEKPYHRVYLDAYYIDKNDVTVAEYTTCVNAGVCKAAITGDHCNYGVNGRSNNPINCVRWSMADIYCKWAGKKLPTEAQWEKAARGTDGRIYPWGNDWDASKACHNQLSTCVVGSYPQGASPYGVMDMAGNVWDWCRDWDKWDYENSSNYNPHGPEQGVSHVLRGGAWNNINPSYLRASYRGIDVPASGWCDYYGFRCVREDLK